MSFNVRVVLAASLGVLAHCLLEAPDARAQQSPAPWQPGVSYRIEARLEEDAQVLSARARVWYRNESPDTLREFYFHLYLNAFRPNSAWATEDLRHGIRTFQDLGPDDHGFERIERMAVDAQDVALVYPYAPDSTIVRLELPDPLPPGGEITLDYDWKARPSTVPRRQGRRGRHWDFAQWYPRVVVYDLEGWRDHPLYRQGEFYGEFATYDVTLDVADDQVIGAAGVPVEGDPGWAGAAAPGSRDRWTTSATGTGRRRGHRVWCAGVCERAVSRHGVSSRPGSPWAFCRPPERGGSRFGGTPGTFITSRGPRPPTTSTSRAP